jgi:pantetheine-phosphate adenylyltransferase
MVTPSSESLNLEAARRPFDIGATPQEGSTMPSAAIYPGSFDPLTNGHLDIILRARRHFDRVVVAILNNPKKTPFFPLEERVALAEEVVAKHAGVEVDTFSGLLVDYSKEKQIDVVVRGLRAVSDFEYEFQLASMNGKLHPGLETIFFMTGQDHYYLSSSLIREVAAFGGDVHEMVPAPVLKALLARRGDSHA